MVAGAIGNGPLAALGHEVTATTVKSYAANGVDVFKSTSATGGEVFREGEKIVEIEELNQAADEDTSSDGAKKRTVEKLVLKVSKKKRYAVNEDKDNSDMNKDSDVAKLAAAVMGSVAKGAVEGSLSMFKELLKNRNKVILGVGASSFTYRLNWL